MVENAEFLFIDNILQEFTFTQPSSNLISDIEVKFGETQLKSREDYKKCYVGNESIPFLETFYLKNWSSNELSVSYSLTDTRNDDDCEPKILEYIRGNKKISDEIKNDNIKQRELLEKQNKESQVNNLKDL